MWIMRDGSRFEISMSVSSMVSFWRIHNSGATRSASASVQNTDGYLSPAIPLWGVALRTGYLHSQQAIPDVNFNPAAPDGPSHTLSVVGGFLLHRDRTIFRLFDL
jgi:hypothetical protein